MQKLNKVINKIFKDKNGNIILAQKPNPPLIVWVVATVLKYATEGRPHEVLKVIAFGAIFTWAWLELFQGVNYFRRLIGLMVLILSILSFASALA